MTRAGSLLRSRFCPADAQPPDRPLPGRPATDSELNALLAAIESRTAPMQAAVLDDRPLRCSFPTRPCDANQALALRSHLLIAIERSRTHHVMSGYEWLTFIASKPPWDEYECVVFDPTSAEFWFFDENDDLLEVCQPNT